MNDAPQTAAATTPREPGARHGFTLVELLVVILIIGMLAGLLAPAVMRALTKSRNAAIKAEIDMLHMAIMNYKNEYGSFPPCDSPLPWGVNSPAVRHVARLFPRCGNVVAQFDGIGFSPETAAQAIAPDNAIVSWLRGFTDNPVSPLRPFAARKKLYDFDTARVTGLLYSPPKSPSSPYIYIDRSRYDVSLATYAPYYAHRLPSSAADSNMNTPGQLPFNPDTFQILCAGRDGVFGNDDDLSNFWPGTRREYLESLKN